MILLKVFFVYFNLFIKLVFISLLRIPIPVNRYFKDITENQD